MRIFSILAVALLLVSCGKQVDLSSWMGKWIGPEGTYLILAQQENGIEVSIQSLDTLQTYEGKQVNGHIEFTRNDKVEKIQSGDGKDTGMKWLADKKDCLFIQQSEGFCRD